MLVSTEPMPVSSVKNRWLSVVYLVLLLCALPLFFEPPTNTDLMGLKMISEYVAEGKKGVLQKVENIGQNGLKVFELLVIPNKKNVRLSLIADDTFILRLLIL